MIYIGIDPGTHTGVAVWDSKAQAFVELATIPIHQALIKVMMWRDRIGHDLQVVFEDARQRTWFGRDKNTKATLQGAGSIKRDCSIWEDFCRDYQIPFVAVPPMKGGTKVSESYFKTISGWKGRTSNHARAAAMLVLGRYQNRHV